MNEKAFEDTGLMEAAGTYYRNLGAETVEQEINSPYLERALVSRAIVEADVYISVPKFKTHGLTGLSCAIKNNFGLLPGGLKAQTHKRAGNPFNFAEALVEIFAIRRPDLVIVDGVLAMEGNGPASKDQELCSRCETCIEHCPGGALSMAEYPVVNPEACITCYCCQELCPQKAIELK